MSFTFIHTADWQLGYQFGKLPSDLRSQLRDARSSVIDRIAAVAAEAKARHVLVAGDVFDGVTVPRVLLIQMLQYFERHPQLVWHLLPGNHDPAQAGSVWTQLNDMLPDDGSVRLHLASAPVLIEADVLLLPAPLKAKSMSTDPTGYMDTVESADGVIRIGLAHGSAGAFGTHGDAAVPISPTRDKAARLDYLALGDWHGLTRINDRIWYSGTPEPDRFKDNAPGFALAVTVEAAGAVPEVRRHRTALYSWLDRTLTVRGAADLAALAAELKALGAPSVPVLLALELVGQPPLTELTAITEATDELRGLVKHLDLDQTRLVAATTADDLEAVFTGGLRKVADRLMDMQGAGASTRAMQILARLAADATRGASSGTSKGTGSRGAGS